MAVLVDITKCIGCGGCSVACKLWNGLAYRKKEEERTPRKEGALTDVDWTVIEHHADAGESGGRLRFVKRQCMHCLAPACVSACFSTALRRDENGAVVYYPDLCVGCRYCMMACPYDVPRYEWEKTFPLVTKCNGCAGRLRKGEMPACVSVCPTGALLFGTREELLDKAHAAIASDGRYLRHVYGEEEAGGAEWLYLSDCSFESLGFPKLSAAAPETYTHSYLRKVPILAGIWALFLVLLSVVHYRREHAEEAKLYREEKEARREGGAEKRAKEEEE